MYRPTVRYDDAFKDYVDSLFHATYLDRNQIHRLGLFLLGQTEQGRRLLTSHLKKDVPLPSPTWTINDHGLWMFQTWLDREEGEKGETSYATQKEVTSNDKGTRHKGEICQTKTSDGTIRLFIS